MDYTGLLTKFKINRPLTELERKWQLKQGDKLDVPFNYGLATIRLNSTYLETADKFYAGKGQLTLWTGIISLGLLFFAGLVGSFPLDYLSDKTLPPGRTFQADALSFLFFLAIFVPLLVLTLWGFKKEVFGYTYCPIRFNRKNRTVYVFRMDGSILRAAWDEVFFTVKLGTDQTFEKDRFIVGHLLDGDGVTVKETFALGFVWNNMDDMHRYWEYVRRYMQDGPQAIAADTLMYMPLASHKERPLFSLQKTLLYFPILTFQIILAPFLLGFWLGRLIAMHFSKLPVWPAEVEAECVIAPDDQWERDERNNKTNRFGWILYPKDGEAAPGQKPTNPKAKAKAARRKERE